MPNVTIDDLPPVTLPLLGTEPIETIQTVGGERVSRRVEAGQITPSLTQSYIVVSLEATLPNERALAVEAGVLTLTDNGPGATIEIGVGANGIDNTKLAQMADATVKGRASGAGTGNATDLNATQLAAILATVPPPPTTNGVFTSSNAIDLVDTDVALNVGAATPGTNIHIEVSPDQIQCKSNATTANQLDLNPLGGNVRLGQQTGAGTDVVGIYQGANLISQFDTDLLTLASTTAGDPTNTPADPLAIELVLASQNLTNTYARIGFDGTAGAHLEIASLANLGEIRLTTDFFGSPQLVFVGGGGGNTRVYSGGNQKLSCFDEGLDVWGSAAAATPPTTENMDTTVNLFDNDGSDQVARLGFDQSNELRVFNFMQGGTIYLRGIDTGGTERDLIVCDPDDNIILHDIGSEVARTLPAASGGFEANNTLTGGGFERVLTTSDIPGGVSGINPNILINGDFRIWQRGTSFPAAFAIYTADRFNYSAGVTTAVVTVQQSTTIPASTSGFSLQVDVTTADAAVAANDFAYIETKVEGNDAQNLNFGQASAETITLTFWVRSPKTGVHSVGINNNANDRNYIMEYSVAVIDTWEQKVLTFVADNTGTWLTGNGIGLTLKWVLMAGVNHQNTIDTWQAGNDFASASQVNVLDNVANNFYLKDIKMEVGGTSTQFLYRPMEEELSLCQRYYQKTYPLATALGTATGASAGVETFTAMRAGTTLYQKIQFSTALRATPTIQIWGSDGTVNRINHVDGATNLIFSSAVPSESGISTVTTTTAPILHDRYMFHWAVSAEL